MVFRILLLIVCLFSALAIAKTKIEILNEKSHLTTVPPEILEKAPIISSSDSFVRRQQQQLKIYENILPVQGFHFVNETLVFALVANGSVLRSTDSMMHWSLVPLTLNLFSRVRQILHHRTDPNLIYIGGYYNISWSSSDGGSTFKTITMDTSGLSGYSFHPELRLLVAFQDSSKSLYLTTDFGISWKLVRSNVKAYSWCGDNICMIANVNDASTGTNRFIVSDLLGKTSAFPIALAVNNFIVHPKLIFAMAQDVDGADLFVSNNNGSTFHRARLPDGLSVPYFYPEQILDDRTGAIWIGVNPKMRPRLSPGNLYVSDTDGLRFTLQLENVVSVNNWWDFDAVQSLEGTYLANILDDYGDPDPSENPELQFFSRTLITFDNGNEWMPLTPPSTTNCSALGLPKSKCHLNLFGLTTWLGMGGGGYYGEFYSASEAVGLILATGNVGQYLKPDAGSVVTYMSRDGGYSWLELMKGSTVYEFADHGGVLMLVRNQVPTTSLYYSLDEGITWYNVTFARNPFIVVNVFTLSPALKQIVMFGYYVNGPVVYFGVDFSDIQERECIPEDYESWSPTDQGRSNCVLGRNTVYLRRKRSSPCYNDEQLNHVVSKIPCNCTDDDYECDFDFERTQLSKKCLRVATPSIVCSSEGTYWESRGYRKIPGDTCVHELSDHLPVKQQCGSNNGNDTNSNGQGMGPVGVALLVVGLLLLLLIVLGVGIVIGARSERVKELFPFLNKVPSFQMQFGTKLPIDDNDVPLVEND